MSRELGRFTPGNLLLHAFSTRLLLCDLGPSHAWAYPASAARNMHLIRPIRRNCKNPVRRKCKNPIRRKCKNPSPCFPCLCASGSHSHSWPHRYSSHSSFSSRRRFLNLLAACAARSLVLHLETIGPHQSPNQ